MTDTSATTRTTAETTTVPIAPKESRGSSSASAMPTSSASFDNETSIAASHQQQQQQQQDDRFCCNICFDSVTEPVVTQCGHLYCWPCLYRWLAPGMTLQERASLGVAASRRSSLMVDESRRVCPVCKADCAVPTIVPIYVRSHTNILNVASKQEQQQSQSRPPSSSSATTPPSSVVPSVEQRQEESPCNSQRMLPMNTDALSVDDDDDDDNMGLDIDDDISVNHPLLGVPATIITTSNPSSPTPSTHSHHTATDVGDHTTGLRQRRRATTTESRDETNDIVPTRPMPSRERSSEHSANSQSRPTSPPRNSNALSSGAVPTAAARATLSYGLVLAMHQTLLNATSDTNTNNNHHPATTTTIDPSHPDAMHHHELVSQEEPIPSLHYPATRDATTDTNTNHAGTGGGDDLDLQLDSDPASTVFLSRLLLGLSLFVLICLLSF